MSINVQSIFEQSRKGVILDCVAEKMRTMDKVPATLRGLSDFVAKERKAGNTVMFEDNDVGRNNVYAVSPSWLYVEEGFNLRPINLERAEMFKNAYLERPQSIPPIRVKVVVVEGVTRLKIIDGHHRFVGLISAIAEGAVFNKIIIEEFEGGKDEEIYNMIESANSLQLKMVERAEGFLRLTGWGHTMESIAKRLAISVVTIRRSLVLAKAENNIKQLVRNGKVAGDVAIDILIDCQGTDRNPYTVLIASLEKAEAAGKNKVTAKFVASRKKTTLKPKVVRKTFDSLLPTLNQLRDQLPPIPEGEHENRTEIGGIVLDEVILRLTPDMARQLMAALSDVEATKLAEVEELKQQDTDVTDENGPADTNSLNNRAKSLLNPHRGWHSPA
ncbi:MULTISPECIES: hypothetical protein [Photorhabdus]|uniref:ParB/Sulfiredoxin domain-containing protein n=2 Tax=Photorhabdus TaxID=29487 RepID=A0AAW6BMA1_9GAMM|nr:MULTISPECIES: hypothetical protein [Photorhabdus]EYU16578.1 hypothetical protein BA1DRAFT_00862 [Photorhabdus aegyptia]MDB6373876.1 hypothetical protein [Photorhabdus bodei]